MTPRVLTAIGVNGVPLPAQPAPRAGSVTRFSVDDTVEVVHELAATTSLVRITVTGAAVRWLQGDDGDVVSDGGTLPAGSIDTRSVQPGDILRFHTPSGEAAVEIEEA